MLLLFWALVGWEIVGNYSMEVKTAGNDSTGCRDQQPDGNGHIFGDRGSCSVD
ncbi:hypothetical protein PO124_18470 [Bacillus licheniformis]|nr:hypothetical protein [Bacillus licheniformis]